MRMTLNLSEAPFCSAGTRCPMEARKMTSPARMTKIKTMRFMRALYPQFHYGVAAVSTDASDGGVASAGRGVSTGGDGVASGGGVSVGGIEEVDVSACPVGSLCVSNGVVVVSEAGGVEVASWVCGELTITVRVASPTLPALSVAL